MGRKATNNGVEVRANSIRLSFIWNGQTYKETLRTAGAIQEPTQANIEAAKILGQRVRDEIRLGVFNYAKHFGSAANTGRAATVADVLDTFVDTRANLSKSTMDSYRSIAGMWKEAIGDVDARHLKKSQILKVFAGWKMAGVTLNARRGVLLRALDLAVEDGVLETNPCTAIPQFDEEKAEADPFSLAEAETILAVIERVLGRAAMRYFGTKFFTGTRTGESLALRWEDYTPRKGKRGTLAVTKTLTNGALKLSTKTGVARTVLLNTRAEALIREQMAETRLKPHGFIFEDFETGAPYVNDYDARQHWLRAFAEMPEDIGYRSPYTTRHTYATMMLMEGMTPAFCARQMGHSVEEFLRTYAKWIDSERDELEMARLDARLADKDDGSAVAAG